MIDFKYRIIERANILNIRLSDEQLDLFNYKVNSDISNGSHEHDALDMIFFHIQKSTS